MTECGHDELDGLIYSFGSSRLLLKAELKFSYSAMQEMRPEFQKQYFEKVRKNWLFSNHCLSSFP